MHKNRNCFAHALDEGKPAISDGGGSSSSVTACKAACVATDECDGFLIHRATHACYRQRGLRLARCTHDWYQDLFVLENRLHHQLPSSAEDAEEELQFTWQLHSARNCYWGGHGAEEVDEQGTSVAGVTSLTACKASCAQSENCEGVIVTTTAPLLCFRKQRVVIGSCTDDAQYDLHLSSRALPPPSSVEDGGTGSSTASTTTTDTQKGEEDAFPSDGYLTSPKCDAMLHNKDDKFWKMFPTEQDGFADAYRRPGAPGCFGTGGEAVNWFNAAWSGGNGRGTGRGCDTNWIRGTDGPNGGEDARPLRGPVVLGLDRDIYSLCSELHGYPVPPTYFHWGEDQKLVDACTGVRNFIRVMDWPKWTMCTNIEWQSCLVRGLLPGQLDNEAQFARAPKSLTMAEFRHPNEPCMTDDSCEWGFTTSDIFFWEVCFFNHVCRNKDELFSVDVGEPFHCDVDRDAYDELRGLLL